MENGFDSKNRVYGATDALSRQRPYQGHHRRKALRQDHTDDAFYLKSRLIPGKTVYFFLDEIQHVRDFPRVLDSLYIRDGVDLYVTGSNANLLSSEIATLISGRYVEIKMLPLSFREFVGAQAEERSLAENYRLYLEQSAFPYALALESPTAVRTYLDGIYSTILVKDVMQRRRIADSGLLESVTRFLFDSIGSLVSTKKIADTLTSRGRKVDWGYGVSFLEIAPWMSDTFLKMLFIWNLFGSALRCMSVRRTIRKSISWPRTKRAFSTFKWPPRCAIQRF